MSAEREVQLQGPEKTVAQRRSTGRRRFLQVGALTGLATGLVACGVPTPTAPKEIPLPTPKLTTGACSEWYAVGEDIFFGGPRTEVKEVLHESIINMANAKREASRGTGTITIFQNNEGEKVTHVVFCRSNKP